MKSHKLVLRLWKEQLEWVNLQYVLYLCEELYENSVHFILNYEWKDLMLSLINKVNME